MTDQRTLTGQPADAEQISASRGRTPDGYWLFCPGCDDWVPRHARHDHEHRLFSSD